MLMFLFSADWCVTCEQMEDTISDVTNKNMWMTTVVEQNQSTRFKMAAIFIKNVKKYLPIWIKEISVDSAKYNNFYRIGSALKLRKNLQKY